MRAGMESRGVLVSPLTDPPLASGEKETSMKSRFVTALMAAGLLSSPLLAEDYDDRWYISPSVGLVMMDDDRNTSGDTFFQSLSIGKFLTRDFSLDLRHDRYHGDINNVPSGLDRFKLRNFGLVGRYHLADYNRVRPYVLVGAGIQQHESLLDEGRDVYGALGLGFSHAITERVSMRLEGEARYDNDRASLNRSSGFTDFIVSAGLKVRLGASRPAPTPEPPPAAPAPRPTPPPPPPAPEPEPEPEVIFEFDAMVSFDLDSARLRPGAVAELNEAVALLNLHQEIARIEVAGHTCDLGAASYNQGLSERRAQAVRDYLVENGVDADRMVVRGYGEDRPKVPNASDSNRQQNRRVELVVLERSDR